MTAFIVHEAAVGSACTWLTLSAHASTISRTCTDLGQVASLDGARTDFDEPGTPTIHRAI